MKLSPSLCPVATWFDEIGELFFRKLAEVANASWMIQIEMKVPLSEITDPNFIEAT